MSEQFPPPSWWYETTVAVTHGVLGAEIALLSVEQRDGTRFATYQLPESPVMAGSVSVDGYLFSSMAGDLVNGSGVIVGTVNFTTGIIEIDLGLSPDGGSRLVQYIPGAGD